MRAQPAAIPVVVILALSVGAACTVERADVRTPSGEPPEADTTQVAKVIDAVAEAFGNGDLSTLDTLFHPQVLVYEWGSVVEGWEEYRTNYLEPELSEFDDRLYTIEDRTIRIADGTAWSSYRYTVEAGPADDRLYASGVGTMILQKLRGRWVIVHSHTSAGY